MSLLLRRDWEKLYACHVAFTRMHKDLFVKFLDKIYADQGNPGERTDIDDIDVMMIYLARAEPPIQPAAVEPVV